MHPASFFKHMRSSLQHTALTAHRVSGTVSVCASLVEVQRRRLNGEFIRKPNTGFWLEKRKTALHWFGINGFFRRFKCDFKSSPEAFLNVCREDISVRHLSSRDRTNLSLLKMHKIFSHLEEYRGTIFGNDGAATASPGVLPHPPRPMLTKMISHLKTCALFLIYDASQLLKFNFSPHRALLIAP